MRFNLEILYKSIPVILISGMLFSCINDSQKVRDFLINKNLPIGKVSNIYHVYKDSGRVTSKLISPTMLDYSNRKEHPYSEFPNGIKIINFKSKLDSVTITGKYALNYSKTAISEIKGNVVVINHKDNSRLETEQLFWDERNNYFISEKRFKLTKENDTIYGVGFESKDDLSKHLAKKTTGKIETTEN